MQRVIRVLIYFGTSKGMGNWNRCYRDIPSPRAADPKKLRTKKREGAARSAAGVRAKK